MKDFKILDCTIRDGGYYTNWDFDSSIVTKYFTNIDKLPIDYIEIGYRNLFQNQYRGEFFYTPLSTLKNTKTLTSKPFVLIINEKDISENDLENLLQPCIGYVEMIRIALNPDRFDIGRLKAKKIKKQGFKVALNLMYLSKWHNNNDFLKKFDGIESIIDYLYLVDSFGSIYPNQLSTTIEKVKTITQVKLGFHGHNNLELAFANSIEAINSGVEIIDSTILGMGRGAGNLKTELLLTEKVESAKVDFNIVSSLVSDFEELLKKYSWGTNLPYIISGFNSLPQKKVMDWMGKKFISFNTIVQALQNSIKKDKEIKFPSLGLKKQYKSVLIIGGGDSIKKNKKGIAEFINNSENLLLIFSSSRYLKYFIDQPIDKCVVFIGNESDRFDIRNNKKNYKLNIVLPPSPREFGTYVPKQWEDNTFELEKDLTQKEESISHCSLSLEIASKTKLNQFFLAGFDGYSDNDFSNHKRELFDENDKSFKHFSKKGLKLLSLTPSLYKNLISDSVYGRLENQK